MRKMKWLVPFAAFALLVAACGDDDEGTAKEVSVFGAFSSIEADAVNTVIDEMIEPEADYTAFYEGSESFEEQIKIRVEGGNPPDIAMYPQPGSVVEMAESGDAIALEDLGFSYDELEATFGAYLLSLGEYEGKHYGIPTNVNSKSLVWFNKPVFDAEGYTAPATWDEWIALMDQMVADGYETPLCIGTGSEAATGWPATDWMEDIMLRTAGADVYDQWVAHEIPFNDATVLRAMDLFDDVWAYGLGGAAAFPDIDFRDAPDPMVADPPGCLLHRQASFIVNFFPEGTVVGEDIDLFAFPDIDPGVKGSLIAGELAAVFADRPEVRDFIERMISTEVQCAMGQQEGVQRISPNINTTGACYGDPIVATIAQSILDALKAGGARFDASDLMPSAVGSGSFWTGMNEWMRGKDAATVADEIEASWP
ncbi:MAG: ABC transporter substrate-binding protein [Actinobacteria bacterium]|nr:ABC transporter substrate-binding protein [Actinomycetota bacterium]